MEEKGEFKTVSDVKSRVPEGAEATSVLVGTMPDLYQPTMAFVRLAKGCFLGNLTEVSIPVRFLFVLLGSDTKKSEYYEIGRSIATLMSDKVYLMNSNFISSVILILYCFSFLSPYRIC